MPAYCITVPVIVMMSELVSRSRLLLQALPTTLLFRDGAVVDRVDGFMPEPSFGRRVRFYVARLDKKFGRR